MKKSIYAELPEDLASLKTEDLEALRETLRGTMAKVVARDEETLGEVVMQDAIDQTRAARDAIKAIEAEIAARVATETDFEAELTALAEESGVPARAEDDPAPDPDPDPDPEATEVAPPVVAEGDPEPDPEPEPAEDRTPVLAAGGLRAARPRPVAASREHQPIEVHEGPRLALVSAATGEELTTRRALAEAMCDANVDTIGTEVKTRVASVDTGVVYPPERHLSLDDSPWATDERVRGVVGQDALLASGGLCAPVTPYYELMMLSTAVRPVRDSLAAFQATRGGLQFATPAKITDVTASVGIKTAAQDALGGTNATKNHLAVACPSFNTVYLEMIYRILQFGNLNARAFPELIAQWTDLAAAYHARVADSALLDYIDAHSTATTVGPIYGTSSTVIDAVLYAAAGMASRHRMNPDYRFRALMPAWLRKAISADIVNNQFDRFDVKPDNVEALLSSYGVEPTWYLDTPTGGGQIFATQSAGALENFPTTAEIYVFPEGSFLFLDGGTLDLGVVRDSTLNATNDFQIFMETFEAAAFVGIESLKLTATICNTGTFPALATAITCS